MKNEKRTSTWLYIHSAIDQRTTPLELPIFGDPFTEIALELNFAKGNQIFLLNGKSLQLLQPLDRDAENLSHIVFQVNIYLKHSILQLQLSADFESTAKQLKPVEIPF